MTFPHPDEQSAPPVIVPAEGATVHVKVDAPTVDVLKVKPVTSPLHNVSLADAEPSGLGFTLTFTINVLPTQNVGAGPVGVTVYLICPGDIEFGSVKVCAILVPEPALEPVITAPLI